MSYLIDTVSGKVKPNRVSFLMWSLAPLVAFFAQIRSGVGIQSLLTLTMGLSPLLIFIASFFNKKSEWKLTTFDLVCGGLSFVGFIIYLITKDAVLAIVFSIFADGLASLPTIRKSFLFPETESGWPYFGSVISTVLTQLTLKSWTFMNSAFSIYIFVVCMILFVLIQYKLGKRILKCINDKRTSKGN
jgi:hypothetical protein